MQQQAIDIFRQRNNESAEPLELHAAIENSRRFTPGRQRNVAAHFSILQQFPQVYGIGEAGLSESATPQCRVMAKQLKAYLMFFDQLLANQFAQLGNAYKLFSFDDDSSDSYFSQLVEDPNGTLDLAAIRTSNADELRQLTEDPSGLRHASGAQRRNRFLNHLLASVGEQFDDSDLLLRFWYDCLNRFDGLLSVDYIQCQLHYKRGFGRLRRT